MHSTSVLLSSLVTVVADVPLGNYSLVPNAKCTAVLKVCYQGAEGAVHVADTIDPVGRCWGKDHADILEGTCAEHGYPSLLLNPDPILRHTSVWAKHGFGPAAGTSDANGWESATKAAGWTARSDPQLVTLNGSLLLFGGHNGAKQENYFNDVWRSDDSGRTWRQVLASAPWLPRSYHTAKVMGGWAYMLAGHDSTQWFNDVWRTQDGVLWQKLTANASWPARAACALQVRRGKMYLFGGSDGLLAPIGHGKCMNDVWSSEDGKTWTQVTPAAPWKAREGLQKLSALYGDNDMIVMAAGEAGYFGPYFNDVWGTLDGKNWTQLRDHAEFSARSGNLLLNVGGSLFTFGGFGLPMKHDAWCLPKAGATTPWKKLGDAPWHGRYDYDMEVVNGSIVLLGGEASLFGTGGPYYNDAWILDTPTC